jgi:hypothetical protein
MNGLIFSLVAIFSFGSLLLIVVRDAFEVAEIVKKNNERKQHINKRYVEYLEQQNDCKLIYNYFHEIKEILPESLHNIMLGMSLSNNYYARRYLNEIDVDTKKVHIWMPKKVLK